MSAAQDAFGPLMGPVAEAIWGDPNRSLSTPRELRFGKKGSRSVDLEKGCWFDHEADEGGGVLDLLSRDKGLVGKAAFDFLRDECGAAHFEAPATTAGPSPIDRMTSRMEGQRTEAGLLRAGYQHIADYDYVSPETGELIQQVRRYEHPTLAKQFLQRRPVGNGWLWKAPEPEHRVIYRDADRLKVAHTTVWLTEGEKDADRVAELGFVGLTAPSGSWTDGMLARLQDHDCLILEDNDEAGRRKAAKLAARLRPIASSVKVVRLPGLGDGGDVSDWLDAGGTSDALLVIGSQTALWNPAQANDNAQADTPRPFVRAFVWRDPSTMPRRQWVYGRHLIRKFISATFAPGGVGKSALVLAEAMAMASGKPLLDVQPRSRLRVGYWNGEDPFEETERRALAAAIQHGLVAGDLEGWLFLGSGREDELTIAQQTPSGAVILAPNVAAVIDTIRSQRLDVLIIDPFVSSHRVTENDNPAIDLVAKQWGKIADQTNTAIELVHHTRKTNGAETTVEDGRGAGSLLNAVRSARVLNAMSKDERERAGVKPTEAYFRVENGKANLSPPAEGADWFQVASVDLGNADAFEPSDNVGAVCRWAWPDPFVGVTATDLKAVQVAIDGRQLRENPQANDWIGKAVAEVLGLNVEDKTDRQKVKGLVATWIKNGALTRVISKDERRRERPVIEVGRWADAA